MNDQKMTIYDISQKAGVSIATVSRVLNGNTNVSAKTRQKVLDVIEKCGYSPNVFARGLGPADTPKASAPAATAGNDGAIIAAIAAAVHDKALKS